MTTPTTDASVVAAALADPAEARERHALALLAAGHSPAQAALMSGMPLGAVDRLAGRPLEPVGGVHGTGWVVAARPQSETPPACSWGLGCGGTVVDGGMCERHRGATPVRQAIPLYALKGKKSPRARGRGAEQAGAA